MTKAELETQLQIAQNRNKRMEAVIEGLQNPTETVAHEPLGQKAERLAAEHTAVCNEINKDRVALRERLYVAFSKQNYGTIRAVSALLTGSSYNDFVYAVGEIVFDEFFKPE